MIALFALDPAWPRRKNKLAAEIPKLGEFQGTLASSAQKLADALETESRMSKELSRLFIYTLLISDQDTRVSMYRGMKDEMIQLQSKFGAESSYIEPEILKMDNG